jgi:hypothetical protein
MILSAMSSSIGGESGRGLLAGDMHPFFTVQIRSKTTCTLFFLDSFISCQKRTANEPIDRARDARTVDFAQSTIGAHVLTSCSRRGFLSSYHFFVPHAFDYRTSADTEAAPRPIPSHFACWYSTN